MKEIFDITGSSGLKEEQRPGSGDTTGIFVSLYLIVLAFFVVMNSISNQDQNKVDAATESVTRAFSNPFEPDADFVDVAANKESKNPNDEFYDQISGVFASLVGFDGKFPTKGGDILKVSFKSSDLFEDESPDFRVDQLPFLERLAIFLQAGRESERREIAIVISTGGALPLGPRYWEDINILRSGAFVHNLINAGVVENQLSMGIVKGADDRTEITFYNRQLKNIRQKLTGHSLEKGQIPARNTSPGDDNSGGDGL